ncbi:hypothetical protein ACVIYL_008733 [Bradyrhizobium sp. USDA 3315]
MPQDLPLLVDAYTGYGEAALNVMRATRVFEDAGAGALHLEDQILPKKCGHLNDKKSPMRMTWRPRSRRHQKRVAISWSSPGPTPPPARASLAP